MLEVSPKHATQGLAIDVADLVMQYPGRQTPAVNGISFSAASGTVLAILGPNGAGKTSTVEAMEGYRKPTSGSITILGLDPVHDAKQLAPKIGVMLQQNGAYLAMGPRQMLHLFAAYYGTAARNPDEVLELVGLKNVAKTNWRRLSGGEQQRLSLGLAIIGRPTVAFLDEPTAGMDPSARQVLWGLIRGLKDEGATVVLTTHYLEEAERLADHVLILDNGVIVGEGTPDELRRAGSGDMRFSAQPGIDTAALASVLGATVVESPPGEYLVSVEPTPRAMATLTGWMADQDLTLGDLRGGRQRLEDVFFKLTTDSAAAESATDSATNSPTINSPTGGRRKRTQR
jgi:ABC-2 type transport system ATP-binding protein